VNPNFDLTYDTVLQRRSVSSPFAMCVGEAGYGSDVMFGLGASGGCTTYGFTLEGAKIEVAGPFECPTPGFVLNANLDGGSGDGAGWADVSPTGSFTIVNQGGGDYAGLFGIVGGVCNTARAQTKISPPLPTTIASPQLRFSTVAMQRDFTIILRIRDTAAPAQANLTALKDQLVTQTFCIPKALAGGSYAMELEVSGGNNCNQVTAGSVLVDDFEIVDAPDECP
jgi:hypothetical protein